MHLKKYIKITKEIKSIIKNLDDEISYYTNVDISWYDRYSDNSYIYLLKDDDKIVGYIYGAFITEKLYNLLKDNNLAIITIIKNIIIQKK